MEGTMAAARGARALYPTARRRAELSTMLTPGVLGKK